MKEKNISKKNDNIFDTFNDRTHRSRLKASLQNWIIDEKEYLNEINKLPTNEKLISNFIEEQADEYTALEKYKNENKVIAETIDNIKDMFKWKYSKVNWEEQANHSIGVAAILAKYNSSEKNIIVWLLHDVIEDIEEWENKLRAKWYSEEIISLVKELSEDKSLSWAERKKQYLEHLKNASNDIKTISAADKLYNVRSFFDDYIVEQDEMRNKFNAGKDDQVKLLKNYIKALKDNYSHPIANELEEVIKSFLRMTAK